MKKPYALVAALAVLLLMLVGPGLLGRVAHARIDQGLDDLGERVPYLHVVDHSWAPGWFTSGLLVTLEFVPAGLGSQAATAGLAGVPPMQFKIRSELLHGPVLGTSGVGVVRIRSHVVLEDDIRAKLVELLGTDEPVHLTTRLGLFGGATLTLAGEGRTVKVDPAGANPSTLAWDDFKLVLGVGSNGNSYELGGRQPRIEISDAAGSRRVLLTGLRVEGDGERVTQDLYAGKVLLALGSLHVESRQSAPVEVNDVRYDVQSIAEGDYFKYVFKLDAGAVKYAALDAAGLQVKEVHYDLTLRHLHLPTLQKLMAGIREASAHGRDDPGQMRAAVYGPLREQGIELLAHEPELLVDRVGIVTPEGELALNGSIRLVGVTGADVENGVAGFLPRIVADLKLETVQALLEKLPNGARSVGMGVDNGYLKREGAKLTSHIEFQQGKLSVNGKPLPLPPGLGAQAPPQ